MRTKNISMIVLAGCLTLITNRTVAQEKGFHYGTRFGFGESQIQIEDLSGEQSKLAVNIGIASSYQFSRYFGLTADFTFSSIGGKFRGTANEPDFLGVSRNYVFEDKFDLYQGELPLNVKFSLPVNDDLALKVFGGPSMHFQFAGLQSRRYEDDNHNADYGYSNQRMQNLETVSYGMIYGAGLEVNAADGRQFFLDFRTNQPITDIGTIYGKRARSNYYLISIGYLF